MAWEKKDTFKDTACAIAIILALDLESFYFSIKYILHLTAVMMMRTICLVFKESRVFVERLYNEETKNSKKKKKSNITES